MAAATLLGETTPHRMEATGFDIPRSAKTARRSLINHLVDILAHDDVAILGEMGAFLVARRGIGRAVSEPDTEYDDIQHRGTPKYDDSK